MGMTNLNLEFVWCLKISYLNCLSFLPFVLNFKPMEYEKALSVLKTLLVKHPLDPEEKEAVRTAIGVLTLGTIAKNQFKNRAKAQRTKQDKEAEW